MGGSPAVAAAGEGHGGGAPPPPPMPKVLGKAVAAVVRMVAAGGDA
jgi:hypothetical protein